MIWDLVAILLVFPALLICLMDWRRGLLICLAVGFLQDPLRKVIPGEPIYLTVLVVGFAGVVFIGAVGQLKRIHLAPVFSNNRNILGPLRIFIALVLLQALMALARFGSPVIAGIGILAYLSPIPALWLAYHYVRDTRDIERFIKYYIAITTGVSLGIYLSLTGYDWDIFRQVGAGLNIYDRYQQLYIEAHTGFMRSPEIAAWHLGTGACLLFILALVSRTTSWRLWAPPLMLFLIGTGMLTGRRKMLIIVVAFLALYGLLLGYFRHQTVRRGIGSLVGVVLVLGVVIPVVAPPQSWADVLPYLQRGGSVFGDAAERFNELGIGSIFKGLQSGGFFGLGAGIGSQGAQHFGVSFRTVGWASEGGLGKIAVELGVPGLVVFFWLLYEGARHVWRIMVMAQRHDPQLAAISFGLVTLLVVNLPVFVAASQIYGDPFVLLFLGWCLGFVLAVPKVIQRRELLAHAARHPTELPGNQLPVPG